MSYQVKLSKQVQKKLKSLNAPLLEKVKMKLKKLEDWPVDFKELDIKPMKGAYEGFYRLRVADLRMIFCVDEEHIIIYIDSAGFRGNVYKN